MTFIKAVKAFLNVFLGGGECSHRHVNLIEARSFCPDCGYRVKMEWIMTHCRSCSARRVPQKALFGDIKPLQQFCRHCGHEGFRIVKKDRIEAYELMYAISTKTVIYTDEPVEEPSIPSPFRTKVHMESGDIFEAEVVSKTEFKGTRSAFKTTPMEWQRNQEPTRYGAKPSTVPVTSNLIPFRKSS